MKGESVANYWLAVGPPGNWETAFEQGHIWGLTERQNHLWGNLTEGDIVLFYATHPASGIIGYGIVQTKFRQDQPLWPKEISEGRVIWPLRFEFNVERCLPPDDWQTNRLTSYPLKLKARRGFQVLEPDLAAQLMTDLQPKGLEYIHKPLETIVKKGAEAVTPYVTSHDELKQRLVEIGKLQKFIAEEEYAFDIGRLDVVWRRVERSVPTYVFEIQVGGDPYHAIAKLKHAFDLWNSHIFIVASQADYNKVEKLLSGTFHEIGSRVRFIDLEKIEELYKRKKAYLELEKELGI